MSNKHDVEVKFLTRGDDIEMLNEAISLVPSDNELLAGYLSYLKFEIVDQLNIELPKEEYPFGHRKGYSWDEVDFLVEKQDLESQITKETLHKDDILKILIKDINPIVIGDEEAIKLCKEYSQAYRNSFRDEKNINSDRK